MSESIEITTLRGEHENATVDADGRVWRTSGAFLRLVDEGFTWLRGHYEKDSPTLRSMQVAWAFTWEHMWPW
ncbi:MAG TPA: hypothetical protein VGY48_15970 [Vicinamibacterales bacterium]|nr:hypothetical protein [Vicinamibacterales bacterium]